MGYLWKANTGAYAESIQYSDSLIRLIESGKGYSQHAAQQGLPGLPRPQHPSAH